MIKIVVSTWGGGAVRNCSRCSISVNMLNFLLIPSAAELQKNVFLLPIQSSSCVYLKLLSSQSPTGHSICILHGRPSGLQARCCYSLPLTLISKRSKYRRGQMLGGLSAEKSDCCCICSVFWSLLHAFGPRWSPDVELHENTCKVKISVRSSGNTLPPTCACQSFGPGGH